MRCQVLDIYGDYALVRNTQTGTESEVALARLPEDVQVGDWLIFANFEYEKA